MFSFGILSAILLSASVLAVPLNSRNNEEYSNEADLEPRTKTITEWVAITATATSSTSSSTRGPIGAVEATSSSTSSTIAEESSQVNAGVVNARGLALDWTSKLTGGGFDGKIGWYYSWMPTPLPGITGMEFVPMVKTIQDAQAFTPAIANGAKYILGFNEPDITGGGGTGMAVADAVKYHKIWSEKVPASVQIGSISVARGGKSYFDKWKAGCQAQGGCKYDFIPIHPYAMTSAEFIKEIKDIWAPEGKPLWVTEVACRSWDQHGALVSCTPQATKTFMTEIARWMRGEGASIVRRWSWFGALGDMAEKGDVNAIIDTNGKINDLGRLYIGL